MRCRALVVSVLCALMVCACVAPQSGYMQHIAEQPWSQGVEVRYVNSDTLSLRTLSLAVRYNSSFKADSLPVTVRLTAPDGRWYEEPFVIHLEHPYTSASVASVESVPYRADSRLDMCGDYIFSITPLVAVEGVEAIGVEIE